MTNTQPGFCGFFYEPLFWAAIEFHPLYLRRAGWCSCHLYESVCKPLLGLRKVFGALVWSGECLFSNYLIYIGYIFLFGGFGGQQNFRRLLAR